MLNRLNRRGFLHGVGAGPLFIEVIGSPGQPARGAALLVAVGHGAHETLVRLAGLAASIMKKPSGMPLRLS